MQIRPRLEAVIEDMLDGHILLDEALEEFEKLYIQKAFTRNKKRITHTAAALGAHFLGESRNWSIELRYMHISNAGLGDLNPGLNTVQLRLGIGKFFGSGKAKK